MIQSCKFRAAVLAFLVTAAPLWAQSTTVPVGYVTLKAAAGTGTAKKPTLLSLPLVIPLERSGAMSGTLTHVGPSALTDANAGWMPGQLSVVEEPCLIRIISGSAAGHTFLVSTATPNTATTVTVDSRHLAQAPLDTLGIAPGDQYELLACDTIGSVFGTPETSGIEAGANANAADSIVVTTNGVAETFFFSTATQSWVKVGLGTLADATHVPLHPDAGIWFYRKAASELVITLPGRVPATKRLAWVKNAGSTVLAQNWPVDITLKDMGIHNVASWTAHTSSASADKVTVVANGASRVFWYDGANWREVAAGSPVADNVVIPAGSAVTISQIGAQAGYSPLAQPLPYLLE